MNFMFYWNPGKTKHTDQYSPAEWFIVTCSARVSQVTSGASVQGHKLARVGGTVHSIRPRFHSSFHHKLARVGGTVSYDDGTQATIIDGAGLGASWGDKPFALVGSHLSNGDTIIETLQTSFSITARHGQPIPGLFDPDYVLPPDEPTHGEGRPHV